MSRQLCAVVQAFHFLYPWSSDQTDQGFPDAGVCMSGLVSKCPQHIPESGALSLTVHPEIRMQLSALQQAFQNTSHIWNLDQWLSLFPPSPKVM